MTDINWKGGEIIVAKETGTGWGICHRTVDGGIYPLDWQKFKTDAIRSGQSYAKARGARLLVEVK